MFGDEKSQAPRDDAANTDKKPEGSKAKTDERARSQGGYEFSDWAAI